MIIFLRENKGFTGENAAGLEIAQGAFIALVNNDAIRCGLKTASDDASRPHDRYLRAKAHFSSISRP